jgi:predicted TIM-barrel fold metal-dependent hydrolase
MKRKGVMMTAIVGWLVLFLFTLSPAVDYGHAGMGPKKKIDVHGHFHSPEIFDAIENITGQKAGPGWALLQMQTETYMQTFTIEERLDWMSQFGIEKSIFSFPSVYLFMANEQAQSNERKEIAQFVNNLFHDLHQKYPERAFFMADVALTAGDVEWSISELQRAVKTLGLHGVWVPTNINGNALSDPEYEPFFTEAEMLGVPVFIHPESPYCIEKMVQGFLFAIVGFPADEALMVANLIYPHPPESPIGFMDQHPDLKLILTHLGGSIPYIHARLRLTPLAALLPKPASEYLKDFYYDTAIGNPEALEFLIKFLGSADKIMFGTDHPYVPSAEESTIEYIKHTPLSKKESKKIYFKNAESLFGIE